jgi:hypothetical protein
MALLPARAVLGNSLRRRNFEPRLRPGRVVEIRERDGGQFAADRAFDRRQLATFFRRDERKRLARGLRAPGASHAVNVIVRHERHVEVDHVTERVNVDPARGDVGGDEHGHAPVLERLERLRALRLRSIAVNASGTYAGAREKVSDAIRTMLRPREDEHLIDVAATQ